MSVLDEKKEILTTIGSYTSLIERINSGTDETSLFPSINNSKDIVPYMLDTLKVIVGTDALKEMVGELFTTFVDNVEPQLKTALSEQLIQYNAGDGIPNFFKSTGAGVTVGMKDIDLFGKFKSSPTSDVGNLIYDTSVIDFDSTMYNAIVNDGSTQSFGGLNMVYNATTDGVTFNSNTTGTIGDWLGEYVNDAVLINKKEFLTNVMDGIYGSVASNQDKTVEELFAELQINKLIEQLINDDDSFFISQDDYDALLRKAAELQEGIVYNDMGCGLLASSLPIDGMTNLIGLISGATDSYYVADQVEATIDESTSDEDVTTENKETIKDGFFQRIIQIITEMLARIMTTSPQIRAVMAIVSAFQNEAQDGTTLISSGVDDMSNFKIFLKCIIDKAMGIINKFIFDKVVSYLTELVKPVIKEIVQEKINQYIGVIKSLVPINI